MRLWWCSFVDPDKPEGQRFLGVAVVPCEPAIEDQASVAKTVLTEAHRIGCNPGGQVKFVEMIPSAVLKMPKELVGVLLTREQALDLSDAIGPS